MPAIRAILHPTDFSANSQVAFQSACSLARDYRAALVVDGGCGSGVEAASALARDYQATLLILLHVLPPPVYQESLGRCLDWPQPADSSVRVVHRLVEGEPATEILRLAKALACDLIVIGTRGRTGPSRSALGSVAEEVLRKAPCPVMAVPFLAAKGVHS